MTISLSVALRNESVSRVRRSGSVPAVVYGPKQTPISLKIPFMDLDKAVKEAGESTIINLTGLGDPIEVLIQDVSFNPARGGIEHVDFYAIERGKELNANVPLEFVGEAPAVKLGGSLTKVMHEVEVRCRPSKLPSELVVDVTSLVDFDSQIKVKDIAVPEGVTVTDQPEAVVALVSEITEDTNADSTVDMESVQVEAKGKGEVKSDT